MRAIIPNVPLMEEDYRREGTEEPAGRRSMERNLGVQVCFSSQRYLFVKTQQLPALLAAQMFNLTAHRSPYIRFLPKLT